MPKNQERKIGITAREQSVANNARNKESEISSLEYTSNYEDATVCALSSNEYSFEIEKRAFHLLSLIQAYNRSNLMKSWVNLDPSFCIQPHITLRKKLPYLLL